MKLNKSFILVILSAVLFQSCSKTKFSAGDSEVAPQKSVLNDVNSGDMSSNSNQEQTVVINTTTSNVPFETLGCYAQKLPCEYYATKYKNKIDIGKMQSSQSIFVEKGDVFIYSTNGNKKLLKLDQSKQAGTVFVCGLEIEDVYMRSGTTVLFNSRVNVTHAAVPGHSYNTVHGSWVYLAK